MQAMTRRLLVRELRRQSVDVHLVVAPHPGQHPASALLRPRNDDGRPSAQVEGQRDQLEGAELELDGAVVGGEG